MTKLLSLSIGGSTDGPLFNVDAPWALPAGGSDILSTIVANTLTILVAVVAIIALFSLIYCGIQWATSGGDEKKLESAKARFNSETGEFKYGLVATSAGMFLTIVEVNAAGEVVGVRVVKISSAQAQMLFNEALNMSKTTNASRTALDALVNLFTLLTQAVKGIQAGFVEIRNFAKEILKQAAKQTEKTSSQDLLSQFDRTVNAAEAQAAQAVGATEVVFGVSMKLSTDAQLERLAMTWGSLQTDKQPVRFRILGPGVEHAVDL